uniref:Peptidase S8/S53 domain-containing protein n=1 Tax=Panagrolaimus davidi TaxID=227884 RepID=A0A914Q7I2_9BILA
MEKKLKIKESDAYENSGVDCIVWNDGEKWRACITISENLENAKVLTNFCDEHEYGFTDDKKTCYCVKIEKDGNLLEIFTSSRDDHGTNVANTAAGYFPDKPNQSGLAPGAQIYLINIIHTSDAIIKAIKKCIEMKVDIINFSIGLLLNPSAIEIIEKSVQKHGIIIFNAAPNEGPVYNSAAEKGAYVNCQMFIIGFIIPYEIICKMNEKFKETPPNGLYLGTSFAAPNAAGSIACLLSALKANSIQYSPTILKFVL